MPTTRLGLPLPLGTSPIADGDNQIRTSNTILDNASLITSGTFAGRPSQPVTVGNQYLATDTGKLYISNGSAWIDVTETNANAAALYSGTLGTRPAAVSTPGTGASNPGSFWYATDTKQLFVNVSGAWLELTTAGAPPIPIGGMLAYAGTTDPADARYVIADGRALVRATYSDLFTLIGTLHGAGNGTTTFNIPDTRGRVLVGPDAGAGRLTTNNTAGSFGGTQSHVLATGELPSHTHGGGSYITSVAGNHSHGGATGACDRDLNHTHPYNVYLWTDSNTGAGRTIVQVTFSGLGVYGALGTGWMDRSIDHLHGIGADGNHNHSISSGVSGATGSGTAHPNTQPYLVVPKIIRVL